jgi:hypothetical protein
MHSERSGAVSIVSCLVEVVTYNAWLAMSFRTLSFGVIFQLSPSPFQLYTSQLEALEVWWDMCSSASKLDGLFVCLGPVDNIYPRWMVL